MFISVPLYGYSCKQLSTNNHVLYTGINYSNIIEVVMIMVRERGGEVMGRRKGIYVRINNNFILN